MTVEQLRAVHQAQPFQPFTILLADGRLYNVPHSEFLSHSPTGRTIIVYHPDDSFSIIDLLLVTELKVDRSPAVSQQSSDPPCQVANQASVRNSPGQQTVL